MCLFALFYFYFHFFFFVLSLSGKTIKGFQLSQAFVITTTGLRYQYIDKEFDDPTFPCNFDSFSHDHPSDKIRLYPEIIDYKSTLRAGNQKAKSAFRVFHPVPSYSQCNADALTSLGISQSIWLGEYLSLAYQELWTLEKRFAAAYSIGDEALYQTASAVLYGLLQEKQFVKNHVQKLNKNYTPAGVHKKYSADLSNDDIHQFIHSSFHKEHHLFKEPSSSTMKSKVMDRLIGTNTSVKAVISHLAINYCPVQLIGLSSPSDNHLRNDFFSYSISHLLFLSDVHNVYLSQDEFFQSYAYSRTLPLKKFLQTWIKSSKSDHNPEINLIAVDDLFMFSLLTSLNISVKEHITPVTRLVIEKFTYNASFINESFSKSSSQEVLLKSGIHSNENYLNIKSAAHVRRIRSNFFRILLNGRVVTQQLEECVTDMFIDLGLCSSPSVFAILEEKELFTSELGKDEL